MKIHADLLKKLRTAKNWSQEQLSEASGLSLRTIQRLENGGNASIESVRALTAAFEVDSNELILIENDEPMTPLDAVKIGFLKFANFSDMATRFEYWWFFLFVLLITAVTTIIYEKAYQIISVILILPFIAASIRRLNDADHSGWWLLLFLVPYGQVVTFYLLAQPSNIQPNQLVKPKLDIA